MGRGKSKQTLGLIAAAWRILAEIQPASIRAVCYRLFTLHIITSMSKNETNKVSTQLTWAREHDIIPWAWIVDETRAPERVSAFSNIFNTPAGRSHLVDRVGLAPDVVDALAHMGYSSSCNALAAIKLAKDLDLGYDDVIVSVATDGSELYDAERVAYLSTHHPDGYDTVAAATDFGRELEAGDTARHLECGGLERRRIFNLGYYTWVEQQATEFDDFMARRDPRFWDGMRHFVEEWDELIVEFNDRTGARDDE